MEKQILTTILAGKDTQVPLMASVPEAQLNGLTSGQKAATELILSSRDQFVGIQGYAGVGKTTQLKAVIKALDTPCCAATGSDRSCPHTPSGRGNGGSRG